MSIRTVASNAKRRLAWAAVLAVSAMFAGVAIGGGGDTAEAQTRVSGFPATFIPWVDIWTDGPGGTQRDLEAQVLSDGTVSDGRGRYMLYDPSDPDTLNTLYVRLGVNAFGGSVPYSEIQKQNSAVLVHVGPDDSQAFYGVLRIADRTYPGWDRTSTDSNPEVIQTSLLHQITGPDGSTAICDEEIIAGGAYPNTINPIYRTVAPCTITKDEWKLLAGEPNASDSAPVPVLKLAFEVPSGYGGYGTIHVGATQLSLTGNCNKENPSAGICREASGTWYETSPTAHMYQFDADGRPCSSFSTEPICTGVYWSAPPYTARYGIALLDDSNYDSDASDLAWRMRQNTLRWAEFDRLSISAENGEGYSTGAIRFIRPDGTRSDYIFLPHVFTPEQLRREAGGTDETWFDRFPVIEFTGTGAGAAAGGLVDISLSAVFQKCAGDAIQCRYEPLDYGDDEHYIFPRASFAGGAFPAEIVAGLHQDADGVVSPGSSTQVSVGFRFALDGAAWACTGGQWVDTGSLSGVYCYLGVDPLRSRLEIVSGNATWATGGTVLAIDRVKWHLYCRSNRSIDSTWPTGSLCFVGDFDENRPVLEIADDATEDVEIVANIAPPGDDPFRVFIATPDGREPFNSTGYTGRATVRVVKIEELASVALSRTPIDGTAPSGPVRINTTPSVRLSILNENEQASNAGSIASASVTTTIGKLSHPQYCPTAAATCELDVTALATATAADPNAPAQIDLRLSGVSKAGVATIRATVVATAGAAQPIHRAGPLTITFSGSAATLSLGNGMPRLHNQATAGDDRDKIALSAMATDSRGAAAALPNAVVASITGPDGSANPAGITVAPNADCGSGTDKDPAKCKYEITATATSARPLATGTYTLRLTASRIDPIEAEFGVSGPAADVMIEPGEPEQLGGTFAAAITVTDAAGNLVADGTEVTVAVAGRSARRRAGISTATSGPLMTANGVATARFVVIGQAVSTISATAGDASGISVIDTRDLGGDEQASPSTGLSTTTSVSHSTWQGSGGTSASALLDDLGETSVIFLWNGLGWVRYARVDGVEVPGSLDFPVEPGDNLWIGS